MTRNVRVLLTILGSSSLSLLAASPAAADPVPATAPAGGIMAILGSGGGLLLGLVQLIVGLSIAAFAVNKGLKLVSRLLGGLDIWAQVKAKNVSVALLGAGVVISYTNVIGGGISAMTDSLGTLVGGGWYAGILGLVSGLLNLVVAIAVASFAITVVFKVMDRLTKNIDEKAEFTSGNVALGALYAGILIGVSQLVSAGVSGIGTGVNSFLAAIAATIGF